MSDIKVGSKWVCKDECVDVVEVIGVYSQIRYQLIGGSIYVMDKKDFLGTFNPAPIITVGDVWRHKIEIGYYARVSMVTDSEVFYINKNGGQKEVEDIDQFLTFHSLHQSTDPVIGVDSVWRHKKDGELVYIESNDGSLHWNLNFSPLGETDMYATDTEDFLSKYEFVCDSKYDSSLVFEGYRFIGKGVTSENIGSLLGAKHGHYHKDVSKYKTMDIYAICKVWNAEPSGCTHHALKKLLHAGERGAKSKITDLEQAIESIEALIKLEKMDIRGDS